MEKITDYIADQFVELITHEDKEMRNSAFMMMNTQMNDAIEKGVLELEERNMLMKFATKVNNLEIKSAQSIKAIKDSVLVSQEF